MHAVVFQIEPGIAGRSIGSVVEVIEVTVTLASHPTLLTGRCELLNRQILAGHPLQQENANVPKNYILIDYENVQPAEIPPLPDLTKFNIRLFLGASQSKLPTSLTKSLQPLGTNVEYHQLNDGGANALDFYIAYMLGVLTTQEPTAFFHIISKDQGFQPLVKTLRARKLHVYLCPALAEIPCLKSGSPKAAPVVAPATVPKPASTHKNKPAKPAMKAVPADIDRALAHLELIRKARPRKMTTLKTSLISHFKATHDDQRINHLIEALLHGSKISHDEKGALTYNI